jgi:hypothetical protein
MVKSPTILSPDGRTRLDQKSRPARAPMFAEFRLHGLTTIGVVVSLLTAASPFRHGPTDRFSGLPDVHDRYGVQGPSLQPGRYRFGLYANGRGIRRAGC